MFALSVSKLITPMCILLAIKTSCIHNFIFNNKHINYLFIKWTVLYIDKERKKIKIKEFFLCIYMFKNLSRSNQLVFSQTLTEITVWNAFRFKYHFFQAYLSNFLWMISKSSLAYCLNLKHSKTKKRSEINHYTPWTRHVDILDITSHPRFSHSFTCL